MENFYRTLVLILLGIIIYLTIGHFLAGIVSAFVIAFFMLPIHRFFIRKLPNRISAFLLVFFLLAVLFTSIYFVSDELVGQARQYIDQDTVDGLTELVSRRLDMPGLEEYAGTITERIREVLLSTAVAAVSNIPAIATTFLLTFFLSYYLLVHWDSVAAFIKKAVPFRRKETIDRIKDSFYKIFYGLSIIALIEFTISLIGFSLAGVKLYLFLALLVGIAAFVPFFGPIMVWLPLMIYFLLIGNTTSAVIVLITGLILTVFVDNILVNILVGKRSNINPAFMILGILGGVPLFGLFGFIVGPLLIIIFVEYTKEYLERV
jgi:predicted PurR-regulated permease PerM